MNTPAPRTAAHARTTPPAGGMAGGDIPAGPTPPASDSAAAGLSSSRASGGADYALRLERHARRIRDLDTLDAFKRGVPEADALYPHLVPIRHAAAARRRVEILRGQKGA